MFADDLTIWKSGPVVKTLGTALTAIATAVVDWAADNNMILAEEKCETILFTNYAKDPEPRVLVKGIVTPVKATVRLLGVYLDKSLTFHAHVDHLITSTAHRTQQLKTVANSTFGPSQFDLGQLLLGS